MAAGDPAEQPSEALSRASANSASMSDGLLEENIMDMLQTQGVYPDRTAVRSWHQQQQQRSSTAPPEIVVAASQMVAPVGVHVAGESQQQDAGGQTQQSEARPAYARPAGHAQDASAQAAPQLQLATSGQADGQQARLAAGAPAAVRPLLDAAAQVTAGRGPHLAQVCSLSNAQFRARVHA